jgi:hypothetical protein
MFGWLCVADFGQAVSSLSLALALSTGQKVGRFQPGPTARIVGLQRQYSHSGEHKVSSDTFVGTPPTVKCHWWNDPTCTTL